MNSSVHFDSRISLSLSLSCEAVGTGWNAASGHTRLSSYYSEPIEIERKKERKKKIPREMEARLAEGVTFCLEGGA